MNEIRTVKLSAIDPNPYRDGEGSATWESIADPANYGYNEAKLETLQRSIATVGFWAGVHVRPHPDKPNRYQLAFGHHRIEAARRVGVKEVPVICSELDEDSMLKMMALENNEEFGHDFLLGTIIAVEGVVKAYAAGQIKLEAPASGPSNNPRADRFRFAPSFVAGVHHGGDELPYVPLTVAKYLGWLRADNRAEQGVQADHRVLIALSALELIEQGVIKRNSLKGETMAEVKRRIDAAKGGEKLREQAIEADLKVLEEAKERYAKQDDKNRVKATEEKIERARQEAEKEKKKAAKNAVSAYEAARESGKKADDALREALQGSLPRDIKRATKNAEKAKKVEPWLAGEVESLAHKVDKLFLEEQRAAISACKSAPAKRTLAESVTRCIERGKALLKEIA